MLVKGSSWRGILGGPFGDELRETFLFEPSSVHYVCLNKGSVVFWERIPGT
jgi:hypothetical protein